MALDMRACLERAVGPLPAREERYRIFELIAHCRETAPPIEADLWAIALHHEERAVAAARLEPGAQEAVDGVRVRGFRTAVWTNNAGVVARRALARFGLDRVFDLIVTRDDMRALKPDPDGWRVIAERLGAADAAVVVGDSWVDGLAAAAAGVPFVAYQAREADLERWGIKPVARLTDLTALPVWLEGWNGHSGPS